MVKRRLTFTEQALALDINELEVSKIKTSEAIYSVLTNEIIPNGKMLPGKIVQILLEWSLYLWGTKNIAKDP